MDLSTFSVYFDAKYVIPLSIIAGVCYISFFKKREKEKKPKEHGSEESSTESDLESTDADEFEYYKMVFLIRNDLKMKPGKVASQCAHAAVTAYKKALFKKPKVLKIWESSGQPKVTLKVYSEEMMMELSNHAKSLDLLTSIIADAGRTQVDSGSKTVCAIGPGPDADIDRVTGHLKLY